jgi:D-alanyl-D-alanine carboxypeptidase (penicillin-binding protein 5/6)
MKSFTALLLAGLASVAIAQTPQPPGIAAREYLLIDLTSHQVLAEHDADARVDMASLTKLMTAYVVFDALRAGKLSLTQTLPVSRRAWDERKGDNSLMFIDTTMTPTVSDLLRGMIVQSGNDASVALAEGVSGSVEAFVALMNRQAQAWGLKNTQFKNVTGLTEAGHYSSARDIATVAAHVIADHPEFYAIYSERQFTYNHIKQDNRNMLLGRDPSVDGLKTGYTDAAGYCLVASAVRDMPNGKRRLLSVVLGAASKQARADESQKLMNWGWQAWDDMRLFESGKAVATVPVWKGTRSDVPLGASGALYVSVPKGEGQGLKTTVEHVEPLLAPLSLGQQVGNITVTTAGGSVVTKVPLVALEPVGLASILGRAWDAIRLWVR